MIKFLCPTGHPLSAPTKLAGKPGKCPRCGTAFLVPQASEATAADSGKLAAGGSGSQIIATAGSGTNLHRADEIFFFLCPNGHKLNGPPVLKGKPGQCPQCSARFLIPTDEEIEAAEEEVLGGDTNTGYSEGDTGAGGIGLTGGEPVGIAPPPAGAAGLGYIVARLFERRGDDTELEIFLTEGEIIAPDYYSEVLSTSDYGVFATREADGTFAFTVVPWSAVRRVGLRRLPDLPNELFP
jgi:hypothetical protein